MEKGTLYKFMRLDANAYKVLINKQLYLTRLSELNDPADCDWPIEVKDVINIDINHRYRICSFCIGKTPEEKEEIMTNQLMWSHYADSSRGICLEFKEGLRFLMKKIHFDLSKHSVLSDYFMI